MDNSILKFQLSEHLNNSSKTFSRSELMEQWEECKTWESQGFTFPSIKNPTKKQLIILIANWYRWMIKLNDETNETR